MFAFKTFGRVALLIVLLAGVAVLGGSVTPSAAGWSAGDGPHILADPNLAIDSPITNEDSWAIPEVYAGSNWYTDIYAQNVGSSAADIYLRYYDSGGNIATTVTFSSVPAGAIVLQRAADVGLSANTRYSAWVYTASSSYPLVASAIEYNTANGEIIEYSGAALSLATNDALLPGAINDGTWTSTITAMNLAESAIDIRIYLGSSLATTFYSVPKAASVSYDVPYGTNAAAQAYTPTSGGLVGALIGIAKTSTHQAEGYIGTGSASVTEVTFPHLARAYNPESNNPALAITSTVTCMNPNASAVTLQLAYTNTDGTSAGSTNSSAIASNGQYTWNQGSDTNLADGWQGSGQVTITSGPQGAFIGCFADVYHPGYTGSTQDYAAAYNPSDGNFPQTMTLGVAASGSGGKDAVEKTKARWFLDWDTCYGPSCGNYSGTMPGGVEFVPMTGGTGSKYLMGINEPNVASPQGNTCPKDYVGTWYTLKQNYPGRLFVSPGVGWNSNNITCADNTTWAGETNGWTGAKWLEDFRTAYMGPNSTCPYGCGDPGWTAVAFHCYPYPEGPGCDALTNTPTIIQDAQSWGAKEVWINEWDAGKYLCIHWDQDGNCTQRHDGRLDDDARERRWLDYWAVQPMVTRIAYWQSYDYPTDCPTQYGCSSALTGSNNLLTQYGTAYWMYR